MSKGASWKSLLGFASLALMANRSRAILTIIGITIGIGSVILVSSLGESARALIVGEVSGIGANSIFIEPGPGDGNRIASRADLIALNMRDVEALKRLPELDFAIPYIQGNGLLAAEERFLTGQIVGTEPEVQIFDNFTLTAGRFFTSEEARSGARVAVLGSSAAEQLFPSQNPLGRQVSLRRATFTVIGVAAPQGTKFFQDYDKRAYVPYTAAQWYVFGIDYVQFIAARAAQNVPVSVAQEAVEWSLRETNNIDNPRGEPRLDNFRVQTQEEALEILKTVTTAFQALLIAIGAISLLVSGIGIEDAIIIETDDAILISKRGKGQEVKKLLERLEEEKRNEIIFHTEVYRPWGMYKILEKNKDYIIRKLTINKGASLTYHLHRNRSEHWTVIKGNAEVIIDDRKYFVYEGESIFVPKGKKHQLINAGDTPLEIIEIQSGEILADEDIEIFTRDEEELEEKLR